MTRPKQLATLKVMILGLVLASIAGCTTTKDPLVSENLSSPSPALPPLESLQAGWNKISPQGKTTCSDGSEYHFFVRPGDPAKLMVYLQGGGACWFRKNCDPQMNPSYTIRINDDFKPLDFGAFNTNNADNPVADYTVVYAPYCTADVHLGQQDTSYPPLEEGQEPLLIRHQGRANMQAVLDWTYANVRRPQKIFVTGSSAGAIPSPFYASLVADNYPNAKVAQLGDGAGGYRRINADSRPDEQWGTFNFITQERGFESLEEATFNYEKLYIAAAKAQPQITFAQYDAAHDQVQKNFLALSGATGVNLLDALQANHADIKSEASNFNAFITGGSSHTILRRPEFYTYGVGETSFAAWLTKLVNFEPVQNVTCDKCEHDTFFGPQLPESLLSMWQAWEDPKQQYVEPFKIFDNVYYVGINWVAAYVVDTGAGLVLIDSLYGKWQNTLINNIRKLGLNPKDIKYVINTHGHFDHAGGSALFQQLYDASVVMAEEDWQIAQAAPDLPMFYMPKPSRTQGVVANDGDIIVLGDNKFELFKTPGHTEGVLTLRYNVHDADQHYKAITLGGVGLNFSGVERTQSYIESYQRLLTLSKGVSVSLPNHASMGRVFERGKALSQRNQSDTNAPHPFVDAASFQQDLLTFLDRAQDKLEQEEAGTAKDPLEELTQVLQGDD